MGTRCLGFFYVRGHRKASPPMSTRTSSPGGAKKHASDECAALVAQTVAKSSRASKGQRLRTEADPAVNFPAYFVRASTHTALRRFVASHGLLWLRCMKARGAKGAVVYDIDDTILDGNEQVVRGFEQMRVLFEEAFQLFPVHVVTARPRIDHDKCMRMLRDRGFHISPDRLHMLPTHLYDRSTRHVEDFKWAVHQKLVADHGAVLAKFGDKLWDVAHRSSLRSYLGHVSDADCYLFWDPRLNGTLSAKLPGRR
jgi:hypothetical protein